jgi:hypothetical protein
MYTTQQANIELLLDAYRRNSGIFYSYHLHLTARDIQQSPLFGVINLPIGISQWYPQCQTSLVFSNEDQLLALIDRVLATGAELIGFKLEGVVTTRMRQPPKDFCYYELHTKSPTVEGVDWSDDTIMYSFSMKNLMVVTAKRIYDRVLVPTVPKYEVCFYEHWLADVEKAWRETPKNVQLMTIGAFTSRTKNV